MRRVAAAISFLTGAVIYLLFRQRNLLGFRFLDYLNLTDYVDGLRSYSLRVTLPRFVTDCLPDGLWTLSYILLIDHLFKENTNKVRILWASVIPLFGILSELAQLIGFLPGFFDTLDLVCYILPYMCYLIFLALKQKNNGSN